VVGAAIVAVAAGEQATSNIKTSMVADLSNSVTFFCLNIPSSLKNFFMRENLGSLTHRKTKYMILFNDSYNTSFPYGLDIEGALPVKRQFSNGD
jgi:hypothetical protein